ncbi:hypothetical protein E3E11_05900 [Oecophyllibacter saccharovorans]|uniref:hypothetical protein n=1 Tax=Oecophyllibacter saccharovorans TaxID=2558360 RepID=UPI0011436990|nr:hypothetical protein [Oecophyllibacter saccharovorans]QDH15457.1 hypothetical protein E3E11_05900 [Oecophyllibacter saccharovorans]
MSAFGQLWKRAPLWRLSLLVGIAGLGLAAFFPTPFLKAQCPWLPGSAESLEKTGPADSAAAVPQARFTYPDLRESLQGSVPLGAFVLPLPEGTWHPLLAAQTPPPASFSYLAFVRLTGPVGTGGKVTGLLVVQVSPTPLPPAIADTMMAACHDDRNYMTQLRELPRETQCTFLSPTLLGQQTVSFNPLITETIARLHALDMPLPPLMIMSGWRLFRPQTAEDGAGASSASLPPAQVMTVDLLLAPTKPGTTHLLAPLQGWDRQEIGHVAAARSYVTAQKNWTGQWVARLNQGFHIPALEPSPTPRDPAFHGP